LGAPPTPRCGVSEAKLQTPDAKMRRGLFDIVSCEVRDPRPHPEERACASAPAKSNARARVSKDEDSHGMAFETHRSALGLWKRLRSRLAAMLLSMRANQPAAV